MAFELADFSVNEVKTIFEGQYLWIKATPSSKKQKIRKNAGMTPKLAKDFALEEKNLHKNWKKKILKLRNKGNVAIWGAGSKGVTFCNIIDPDSKLIDCVIDLNSNKQGKYIPGTGHPIVDHDKISSRKITSAIMMNPNYFDEVKELLKKSNHSVDLIS